MLFVAGESRPGTPDWEVLRFPQKLQQWLPRKSWSRCGLEVTWLMDTQDGMPGQNMKINSSEAFFFLLPIKEPRIMDFSWGEEGVML